MASRRRPNNPRTGVAARPVDASLRVIGGALRGRVIPFGGEAGMRPMKDRVREAVFNLIGPRVVGKQVIDLFAGTGAVSFEALSRGAAEATLFERKFPAARRIEETAAALGMSSRVQVSAGDTFVWARRIPAPPTRPWLVCCTPPYEFYLSRRTDLQHLLQRLWDAALGSSLLVVECDDRCDPVTMLPFANWTVRKYPPAVIGIAEKPRHEPADANPPCVESGSLSPPPLRGIPPGTSPAPDHRHSH